MWTNLLLIWLWSAGFSLWMTASSYEDTARHWVVCILIILMGPGFITWSVVIGVKRRLEMLRYE